MKAIIYFDEMENKSVLDDVCSILKNNYDIDFKVVSKTLLEKEDAIEAEIGISQA